MLEKAVALNGLLERHKQVLRIVGWVCFAVVCADYARFIDLPTIIVVPFWVGVTANVFRWGLWEGFLKGKLQRAMLERNAATEGGSTEPGVIPPPAEG